MTADPWRLFPYPTLKGMELVPGSILSTHPACASCPTKECLAATGTSPGEAHQCRFGLTYSRIDGERTLVGVVASDLASPSSRTKKRIRLEKDRLVRTSQIRRAIEAAREVGPGVVDSFENARAALLLQAKSDPEMQRSIAAQYRRDAEANLNQSHDFLQLVKLVRGYAEKLLHDRFPDLPPEDAAEKLPDEGAIYFSTTLMTMKVDALLFISEINRATGNESRFKIHPMVLKYVRIYDWQARQKKVKIRLEGECHSQCNYNAEAIGALIQGLLDNLVKYSPAGSETIIRFESNATEVLIEFISLGPKIEDDELSQIFLPHYRARSARRTESGGQGIGLATVKQISDVLGLGVQVSQEATEHEKYKKRYWTNFSVTFSTQ